jgi:hypothetical protein
VSAAALALLVALAAAPAPAAEARPLGWRARAEKGEVRLGQPFAYEIEVRHAADEEWALDGEPNPEPFRATGARCRREEKGGEAVTTCAMTLALLDLGAHDVPAVRLRARGPKGEATLDVPGPRVEGVGIIDPSVAPGALELRDLAAPVPVMVRSWRLLWWAGSAAAAAALAFLAWRAWERRGPGAELAPPPSPQERFARRLDQLEAERLARKGEARAHWVRLSEMVREYLAAVTGLEALEMTSGELAAAVARLGDPRIGVEALRAFGEEADLVKFARAPSSEERCAEGIAYARALLARTMPVAPAPSTPVVESAVRPERGAADQAARSRGTPTRKAP